MYQNLFLLLNMLHSGAIVEIQFSTSSNFLTKTIIVIINMNKFRLTYGLIALGQTTINIKIMRTMKNKKCI